MCLFLTETCHCQLINVTFGTFCFAKHPKRHLEQQLFFQWLVPWTASSSITQVGCAGKGGEVSPRLRSPSARQELKEETSVA